MFDDIRHLYKILTTKDTDEFTEGMFYFNELPPIYDIWVKIIQYKLASKLYKHMYENDISRHTTEFEYSQIGRFKNNTIEIVMSMTLSAKSKHSLDMDVYTLRHSNTPIPLSFDGLCIESITHKESNTVLVENIPLSSSYTVKHCGDELMTEYESLLSSFNHYPEKERVRKLPNELLTICDPNDRINRTIQIAIASMLIDMMAIDCFDFDVTDGLIYYTHALQPTYNIIKNLPNEYFNSKTFKQLELVMKPTELEKLKNLKKLIGGE